MFKLAQITFNLILGPSLLLSYKIGVNFALITYLAWIKNSQKKEFPY